MLATHISHPQLSHRLLGLVAPFTVEGTFNRVVFETWLETCLIPVLQPGQVVLVCMGTIG